MMDEDAEPVEIDPYVQAALAEDEIETPVTRGQLLFGMSRRRLMNGIGVMLYALVYPALSFSIGYRPNGIDTPLSSFELIELYCFGPGILFGMVTIGCYMIASRLLRSVTYIWLTALLSSAALNSLASPFVAWGLINLFLPGFHFWHHLPFLPTVTSMLIAWLLPIGYLIAGLVIFVVRAFGGVKVEAVTELQP